MVEPPDPFQGREFDVLDCAPRTAPTNDLGLEAANDRLGHRVISRIASASDGGLDTGLGQALGVVIPLVIQDQPDGPLPHLWGVPPRNCHDSNLSSVGASHKPGAIQTVGSGRLRATARIELPNPSGRRPNLRSSRLVRVRSARFTGSGGMTGVFGSPPKRASLARTASLARVSHLNM